MNMNPKIYISSFLETDYPIVYNELCKALNESDVEYIFLPYSKEVWARDYMPVHIGNGDYIGFNFCPDYLSNSVKNREYITNQKKAIGDIPINFANELRINIDGGNMVFCDDKVIMTDKIFSENPNIKQSHLINILEDACNAELILIPWDMEEPYGHADGMVSYLGNGKLLLNNYSQMGKEGIRFSKLLHKILNAHFIVTELHYSSPQEEDNFAYINYLETSNSIIMPALSIQHDSKSDVAAFETFKEIFKKSIIQVYARPLIKRGGAIHCITWEFYKKDNSGQNKVENL